jgi:hypothetical protein
LPKEITMNDAVEQSAFADLANLEKALAEDTTGERAQALLAYFREVAKTSESLMQNAGSGQHQLVSRLNEAFQAAQRIVRHVWETLHNATLPA